MRIDAHIHLYDTTRPEGVPWPPRHVQQLYQPHLPEDFRAVSAPSAITHAIVVEASPWVADNDWLLGLVQECGEVLGGVGNLDPRAQTYERDLARLAKHPKFLGVRPRLRPAPGLRDPEVAAALALLGECGLTLELNVPQYPVADVAAFARAQPNLRVVANHLAGARLRDGVLSPQWRQDLAVLRDLPNTFCKLSAFYSAAGEKPAPTDPAHYRKVFDAILDVFGTERVFFGSNWPVSKLGGDYASLPVILEHYLLSRDPALVDVVFRANTLRAYGLDGNGRRDPEGLRREP